MAAINRSRKVFEDLCAFLDEVDFKYERVDEDLFVRLVITTESEDNVIYFISVYPEQQLVSLSASLEFEMNEDKRMDGVIACCLASNGLPDGHFVMDDDTGIVHFEAAALYLDSEYDSDMFNQLIGYSTNIMDIYAERFKALNNGTMNIAEFDDI